MRTLTVKNAVDGMTVRYFQGGYHTLRCNADGFWRVERTAGDTSYKTPVPPENFHLFDIVEQPAQPSGSLAVAAALPTIIEGFRVLVDEMVPNMLSLMARLDQKGCSPVEWILATAVNNRLQKMQEILGDSGEANHGE